MKDECSNEVKEKIEDKGIKEMGKLENADERRNKIEKKMKEC